MSQLLTAPHMVEPQMHSSMMVANHTIENLAAERFALRDIDKGTNMDYMSYANFVLANKDPTALLNSTLLQQHSEKTFQTFFKHFVTSANRHMAPKVLAQELRTNTTRPIGCEARSSTVSSLSVSRF